MTTATTSVEPNAEAVVVMQGYLKKKSPKALGKGKVVDVWQKRYFVLTGAQLKYYKDKQGAEQATSSSREPLKMIAMAQVHSAAPNPKHLDMLTIDLGAERKVKGSEPQGVPGSFGRLGTPRERGRSSERPSTASKCRSFHCL